MKLQSINPHNQSIIGKSDISSKEEILYLVNKARSALFGWNQLTINQRCMYVKKFKTLLIKNRLQLARLITLEAGKPLKQSLDEIDFDIKFIQYYIKNGPIFLFDERIIDKQKELYKIVYEPYGVCACICPWNFPLSTVTSGVLPAIIAGNTVIVKPSEYTSLSQKLVVDLINQTGLPDGVVNTVIGKSDVGKTLINSDVDLVWFTGSTKTGLEIFKKCGEKFIKCILEMGGSSAAIVRADAILDNAIENIFMSRFLNNGQVCTSIKRLFVDKSIYDKFFNRFCEKMKQIKIGNPFEKIDIGPLINKRQLQIIVEQVGDAIEKGATVYVFGEFCEDNLVNGNYYKPTLLTNIKHNMKIMTEETFGPILPIVPFETDSEAIVLANNTEYGLSNEIYTSDYKTGLEMAKALKSGVVSINTDYFFRPDCPFGGYKKSGMGKEYGRIGMLEFARVKTVALSKT